MRGKCPHSSRNNLRARILLILNIQMIERKKVGNPKNRKKCFSTFLFRIRGTRIFFLEKHFDHFFNPFHFSFFIFLWRKKTKFTTTCSQGSVCGWNMKRFWVKKFSRLPGWGGGTRLGQQNFMAKAKGTIHSQAVGVAKVKIEDLPPKIAFGSPPPSRGTVDYPLQCLVKVAPDRVG